MSKQKQNFCTQHVVNLYFWGNSMNNLLSYCGLTDARTRTSEKDLPVTDVFVNLVTKWFNSRECLIIRCSPIKSPSATCPPRDRATQRIRPNMQLHVSLYIATKDRIYHEASFMGQFDYYAPIISRDIRKKINIRQMFSF